MELKFLVIWTIIYMFKLGCSNPRVTVEQGELEGIYYTVFGGRKINAFLGVPYAAPQLSKHRFKEPQPMKPWAGVWNASMYASPCFQYDSLKNNSFGEDDCLYLNIYTPKLPKNGVSPLMDVIFYIHGGAFMFGSGSGSYPNYLLKSEDVILVTINYRLGAIGFFSTGDEVVPGNNGLKDQVAALRWVHHNIIKFGGNPASVTIYGNSAGAASVHYHYLSPLSEGLFQRGISQSGSVFPQWTLPRNVTLHSTILAFILGCPVNTTRDMVKCLQRRPGKQIAEATKYFYLWRLNPFSPFGPVIEPKSPNSFLSEDPLQLLLTKVSHLPWLVSITQDEGLYPAAEFITKEDVLKELDEQWENIAPHLLQFDYVDSAKEKAEISNAIKKYYLGEKSASNETIKELIKMAGDRFFNVPIRQALRIHNSASSAPAYCYKFNYRGNSSLSSVFTGDLENYGVSHADDDMYVTAPGYGFVEGTESDRAMINFMVDCILSFAKSGKPVATIDWPSVPKHINSSFDCLTINSAFIQEICPIDDPEADKFWNSVLTEDFYTSESEYCNADSNSKCF